MSPMPAPAERGLAATWAALRRGFVAYARWLDGISWRRFFVLAVLTLIAASLLAELPPFSLRFGAERELATPSVALGRRAFEISVDESGVHIRAQPASATPPGVPTPPPVPLPPPPHPATPAAGGSPASAASAAASAPAVTIRLPKEADTEAARRAVEAAREEIRDAVEEAVAEARDEAVPRRRRAGFSVGDHLPGLALVWIAMSMIIKVMAAGRIKAEAQAQQATALAEGEALKRQVVEARMAAMQAQVEPHFLFNTLASIDHLIETDPPRASAMQKHLIALLRAAMPTMREANAQGTRALGRELAVIRPYLEILKMRMEERLHTELRVPDGLLSAEFPPMMLMSLVENAIKHGLEPKAEGGTLTVSAEIVHGKLAVTVADTGLGFGRAATAGTGIGLSNIRERLALRYGNRASLVVAENPGGGTAVTITVPYAAHVDTAEPAANA